jgi:hypothetical protein
MNRPRRQFLLAGLIGILALVVTGCANVTPVEGVPFTVEGHNNYKVQHTFVWYRDDTLYVEGRLSLSPGAFFNQNAHFDIRFLDANGQILAVAPARIERDEPHRPHDPFSGASFKAKVNVPFSQVARIEAVLSKKPKG